MNEPIKLKKVQLRKGEDRRIRAGHPWVYSNEVDNKSTPLKSFNPGEEVTVVNPHQTVLGHGYINPHSLIAVRILSFNADTPLDEQFFTSRMKQALQLRQTLFKDPFYRLVFSEGDGLPGLVIDRYANDFVLQLNTAGMEHKKSQLRDALHSLFPEVRSLLLRNQSGIREQEGLSLYTEALHGEPREVVELIENNLRFKVPLLHGQKTGWFYDQRFNRQRLCAYSADKKVLDVFSYLGGFGLQAAGAGASHVDCVDASATACNFIADNAKLNQLDQKISVICADAFDALKSLLQQKQQYDVIVLDPPAFIKKAKDMKAGAIAYLRLNELALKLLSENGILISCSCSMHLSMEALQALIQRAAVNSHCHLQLLERGHQGPDHPIHPLIAESDYLKAIFLRKISI